MDPGSDYTVRTPCTELSHGAEFLSELRAVSGVCDTVRCPLRSPLPSGVATA